MFYRGVRVTVSNKHYFSKLTRPKLRFPDVVFAKTHGLSYTYLVEDRAEIFPRETLRDARGNEEDDQVGIRVSAPMVFDHNIPVLHRSNIEILVLKLKMSVINVNR